MKSGAEQISVPRWLKLKHRLAITAFAKPINALRRLLIRFKGVRHPELGLLRQEDRLIDSLLGQIVQPDWHCLDIGGHLGLVSHQLRVLAPRGSLTIIEASPGKAAMLTDSFPMATVHSVAVTDDHGEISFFENLTQSGFSSIANRQERGATREITVPARRLDDLIGDAPVDFIKIDVEGFEYPALKGGAGLLAREKPVVLFEAGALNDHNINASDADAMFRWMTEELGYQIFAAFDLFYQRPPLTADQFERYRRYPFLAFNYFAMPKTEDTP